MLCVYPANCTDFSNNGMGVISPSSAIVKETLNGSYELEIVHPYDANGKWQRLVEGYIVRAPVPAAMTPQVKLAPQTSTSGMVYRVSTNRDPLRLRSGTGTKYKILGKYKKGTQVIVLAKTTSSWYEVTCPDGKHGYMSASYLTYVKTLPAPEQAAAEVVEARQLRDQPFRIYRVVPELDKVTAYARHVFYDLLDNMIRKLEPGSPDTGATVVQSLSEGCLSEHPFTFYSDLTSTAEEVSFENKNPVDCLLGSDGIIEKYGGELQRDWFDVFIVDRIGSDTNIEIRQGKNLTGIKYDVDMTDVTTRIMPTGQDKDGKVLYLPEIYVDSPLVESYPSPKWMHLDVSGAKEVTKGKSSEKKSKSQCYTEMRQAAQDEFDKGCDLPTVTLTVEFIDVTETEEYKQYTFLQSIFLGDAVRVVARGIGVSVAMRMTEYSYDCLTRKYTKMTLGSVSDTLSGSVITSRQLPSGIITGSKLALGSVGIGQLQDGAVGELQIQEAAIGNAHIQNAAIGAANIQTAAIEFAHIAAATINSLNAGALEATTAKIASLKASDIQTDSLAAALAAFTVITCGTATFDAATIRHLVAQSMNLEYGAAGQVFIQNLAVEYAQMIGASIGNLCIKASNGQYYIIDVDGSGNVTATLTMVTEQEIDAGQTEAGRVILETSITASDLNTGNLLATFALVNQIDAARIDVDQLFARQAFIDQLNTSVIQSQDFIQLVVGQVDDTVDDAMKDATPAVLRIDSSRGTVFKDNNVSTVLSVSVHYGKQIIENITALRATFGATAHLQWEWLRMDEDRYGIISADDSRLSDGGFRLALGPADVDVKVTFRCALITD
jgi:phage minor structural protein